MKRTKFNFVPAEMMVRTPKNNPILEEFAEALQGRPGEWAEWPLPSRGGSYEYSIATRISHGSPNAPMLFRHGYQGACRRGVLYVRYIGTSGAVPADARSRRHRGGLTSDC